MTFYTFRHPLYLAYVLDSPLEQPLSKEDLERGCSRDNPGRPVPEETFTHLHPSWSTFFLYHLSPFATVHGIVFIQLTCLTVLSNNLFPVCECFFWYRPTRVVPDKRPLNGCCCCCDFLDYIMAKFC